MQREVSPKPRVMFPRLGALSKTDLMVLRISSLLGTALVAGLTITGVWTFLRHEPDKLWSDHVIGANRPDPTPSEGVADIHAVFADLAGMLALFVAVWVSYRLMQRISWAASAALLIVFVGLFSGGRIRFNATIRDGDVDVVTRGYGQIFGGDVDVMVTDTADLSIGAARVWTLIHVAVLPAVVALALIAVQRARRQETVAAQRSWLERLDRQGQ